ncbi:MAG TPA: hypothetical protein VFJ58_04605, partial [Armatimonadota bacterium]|nr:hypothetical protein [Armatimonadota bacterium]
MNRRMWLGLQARGAVAALLNRLLIPTTDAARYPQDNMPDYALVDRLHEMTQNKVFKERLSPHWFAGGDRFWYCNDLSGGRREFIVVDALAGKRLKAFDHSRMAKALTALTGKKTQADRLPIEALEFQDGDTKVLIYNTTQAWEADLRTYTLRPFEGPIPGLGTLSPEARPHRSGRTGPETMVTFLNETDEEALLYWIDTDGNRKAYGVVPPHGRRTQHTFSGHVWLLTDRAGKT